MTRPLSSASFAALAFLASLLLACSDSTPGRGVSGGATGSAFCSSLTGTECTCSTLNVGTSVPTGGACSSATVTNGVCCGDLQWPGSGLSCRCESYQCRQSGTDGSCTCGNSTTGPTATCAPPPGGSCCQRSHSYCECGPSVSCDTSVGDVPVALCSKDSAQCESSSEKVFDACQ